MRTLLLPVLWITLCGVASAKTKPQPAAAAPPTKAVADITDEARASIVAVTQIGRGGGQDALGTGFVISEDGLIATNLHVIGRARRVQVRLSDGSTNEVVSIHATDPNLDLAIIRIAKKGLKPLALGDSDKIKQGQPVVAIGHPQGLEYSVVEGVISAMRKVEDTTMIQIAIPIEQGNSGGPLLDRAGRVQGIMTLKSAVTENLGFAHPVNHLKSLIANPNPVPMERWLTIGVLDTKAWHTKLGARWTQHAGVIHAEEIGEGFGGRTLCLNQEPPATLPFDACVTVKLDDEAGAAGLVFCSDGHDQHYGFYPSNGKLRLTRFNGPDVFSWTILADVPSSAYHKGDWNTLRVHVDEEKIQCYVNNTLVTEQDDAVLRGGHAGLCKFRQTKAEFKGFRCGDLAQEQTISDQLATQLKENVDGFLQKPADRAEAVEKLLTEPAAARQLLQERARTLEVQAAALRKLEKDVHRQSVSRQIVTLLQRPADQAELLRVGLLVSKHDNPEVDVDAAMHVMDRMVEELKADPDLKKDPATAAARLTKFLFEENGFHGTRGENIDDLSNSYLNEVLDDREGIPITLSIVYLELARRLHVPGIYGVSLPGRFMLGYDEKTDKGKAVRFIDVFDHGKVLSKDEAQMLIFRSTGASIEEKTLAPATPRQMILRMLYSMNSFTKKPEKSLAYLDLILAIDPDSTQERLNRALTRMKINDREGAKKDLAILLESKPAELDLDKIDALYHSLP
jgi:serine protease Do